MRYEYPSLLRPNHSSSKSNSNHSRRNTHLEYSNWWSHQKPNVHASTYRLKNLDERGLLSFLPSRLTVHPNRVHVPDFREAYILHPIDLPKQIHCAPIERQMEPLIGAP